MKPTSSHVECTYESDCGAISVHFSATYHSDYGQSWLEDEKVESVEIGGVSVTISQLPKAALDALWDYADFDE